MNDSVSNYTLANGLEIPSIAYGTWQMPNDETGVAAVAAAIKAGYRHIDTAVGYRNEEAVGKAIKASGLPREDFFITTKLHNSEHGYDLTVASIEASLERLGTDYIDLYLIHWPNPKMFRDSWKEANAGSWKAIEEAYRAGKLKAIGVSNFWPHHFEALAETAEIAPMVNQIRLCPGDEHAETVAYCHENNILLEGYSPLATGRIFEVEDMKGLAEKYGKSIAQICIRWSLDKGYLPLPKSVTESRIIENIDVFDFELSEDDIEMISGMTGVVGLSRDPDTIEF